MASAREGEWGVLLRGRGEGDVGDDSEVPSLAFFLLLFSFSSLEPTTEGVHPPTHCSAHLQGLTIWSPSVLDRENQEP